MSRVKTPDRVEYNGKTYYAKANGSSVLLYNSKEDIGDRRKQVHAPATTSVRVVIAHAPAAAPPPPPTAPSRPAVTAAAGSRSSGKAPARSQQAPPVPARTRTHNP